MTRIGRYEVREELGRGGAGAVFRAWDPVSNSWVAIKLLLAAHDGRAARRFQREVRTLVNLRHPNVTSVRDWGDAQGRPFLVMDLIEGSTLEDWIEGHGPLGPNRAAEVGVALAEALAAAHAQGVLHRDVKPSNVLLRSDGTPVLTDFGLAKDVALDASQLTVEGGFMGTLGFVAPEQARGNAEALGPSTDVYGLGATLYYALSGQAPVPGTTVIEVLDNLDRPPTSLRSLRPELPTSLTEVVHRCLRVRLEERYRDCELVARDLGRFLRGDAPVLSHPLRRKPIRLAASLTLTSIAALGLGLFLRHEPQSAPPPPPVAGTNPEPPLQQTPEDPLESILDAAHQALEREHWEAALHGANRVLEDRPRDPDALHLRWRALLELQDPQTFEAIQAAVTAEPRPAACVQLALDWIQRGDDERAESALRHGLEAHPDDVTLLEEYGRLLHLSGRYTQAIPLLQRARAQRPTFSTALVLGAALQATAQNEPAYEALTTAVALRPDSVQALTLLGSVLIAQGRTPEALDVLIRAWELSEGTYSGVISPLCEALRKSERPQEALQVLDQGLTLEPGNVSFLMHRSQLNGLLGRGDEELADLDAILAIEPDNADALNNRSILRFERKLYAESLADATRVVEIQPDFADGWTQIGACAFVLGKNEEARDAYARAIELDPQRKALRVGRGQTLQRLGDHAGAIEDYTWVLERLPDYHQVRHKLAEAHAANGDLETARALLEQVLREAPADSPAHGFARTTLDQVLARLAKRAPPE